MHNTSEQFYRYIAQTILDFLSTKNLAGGERFNLYLEKANTVIELYNALKSVKKDHADHFSYKHDTGDRTYETYTLKFKDKKLLVVASGDKVTENFITTLRNQVAKQEGQFRNICILILFSGKLDSLVGGSESLLKEGMPLNIRTFERKIKQSIIGSKNLKKHEKVTLEVLISRITDNTQIDTCSIFDYQHIVGNLYKGKIDIKDYPLLGLFPHKELESISSEKKSKEYIVENCEIFERVEHVFQHGDPTNHFDQLFSDKGINELLDKQEDQKWGETDFTFINKWIEEAKSTNPPEFKEVSTNSPLMIDVRHRFDGSSSAQKRKINFLIFNLDQTYPFDVYFRFDKPIKKDPLKTGAKDNIDLNASGHRIIATFNEGKPDRWIGYADKTSGKKYSLKIIVLPFGREFLEKYLKQFTIQKNVIQLKSEQNLIFNQLAEEKNEQELIPNGDYDLENETKLILKLDHNHEEPTVKFNLNYKEYAIPFSVITEKPKLEPISGLKVWKQKRELKKKFKFDISGEGEKETIKLYADHQDFTVSGSFRQKMIWEQSIIWSEGMHWLLNLKSMPEAEKIEIPQRIKNAFEAYKNYFKSKDCLPSLTPLNEELVKLAKDYVGAFVLHMDKIEENKSLDLESQELIKLGVICETTGFRDIHLSPLHPLVVAYQLELYEQASDENLYDAILKRLNPTNLLPFIRWGKGENIYTPIENSQSPEWINYTNKTARRKGISKEFVRRLIREKITEFTKHFNYLFANHYSPIKINVFNMGDCLEVLQGFFDYYQSYLKKNKGKGINLLYPIELTIYGSDKLVTRFEELTFYNNAKEIKENSQLSLNLRNGQRYEADDLLNAFREKVHFYTKEIKPNVEVEYAHISFFHFDRKDVGYNDNPMSHVNTGISMGGLMSDMTSAYNNSSYRTGFSTKNLPKSRNLLEQTAIRYNALGRVAFTSSLYQSDRSICTTINEEVRKGLQYIYNHSQWVTFIEPKVGLNFFKENADVVIIHYSDQYNNSSGYDAITVTKRTNQYQNVIKEFLEDKKVPASNEQEVKKIIDLFNAINGEWLLKLIAQNGHFDREKISILSGIKAALTIYYHPDIIWIPISLEEVLRVSGNAGLSSREGFFSAKNLSKGGALSDDLLLIGLWKKAGQLQMTLYPIEMKIGYNEANTIKKAKEQGKKTYDLLQQVFEEKIGDEKNSFRISLFKNFFAKLAIVSTQKLRLYNVWEENNDNWDLVLENHRKALLENDFEISQSLEKYTGKFGVISFKEEGKPFKYDLKHEDDGAIITFFESDGYNFLTQSISTLVDRFIKTPTPFDESLLLVNQLGRLPSREKLVTYEATVEIPLVNEPTILIPKKEENSPIEISFGYDINKQCDVKWHPSTTSKVLHTNTGIIGTMGTGKTQFTKSLVSQLVWESKNNVDGKPIGILIFDYKGDYIKDDFVAATNAKVYSLDRLPYNPLALDVYENVLPKLPLHTASSIKETISTAYGLGKKQEQALRRAIMDAYEDSGIDKNDKSTWTKPAPTISDVCRIYLEDEKVAEDSLYAALETLDEFEIFEPDTTKTSSLFDLLEGVLVINLLRYDESIQNLVVAITLDLFYSQMQKAGHSKIDGDFRQLNKMILVDEADNFLSKNFKSIRKLLKEGREFGVGTILSTQFLSHFSTGNNDYSSYVLTWIIHRVNEIKSKEVESLFKLESKEAANTLMNDIKTLGKHHSIVNLAGSNPIYIKDLAFWELWKKREV